MVFDTEKISLEQTGLLSPLLRDYLYNSEKVRHLFSFFPEKESVPAAIAQKQQQHIDRAALANILLAQATSRNASAATLANIAQIKDENTFTVTCAHQPTLLFHPAFYFHKIASTIALAKELKASFGAYNFVPVFWLGSEDHDLEELGSATVGGLAVSWQTAQTGAVGRFLIDDSFKQVIAEFKQAAPNLNIHLLMEEALQHTQHFGAFAAYVTQAFFKEEGLVVLNQDCPQLKMQFASVIEDEILHSRAEAVLQPTLQFLEGNYKAQASVRPINFFYLGKNYRERIVRQGEDSFAVLNRQETFTRESIKTAIAETPENFSPNVIFRPLYQETVLPNVAFVGGGAECSYWLQQKALFDYYKVAFPIVLHRTPVVVLPQNVVRKMSKLQLITESVFKQPDAFVKGYLEENFGNEISLKEATEAIAQTFAFIEEKLAAIDSTLAMSVKAEKQKALAAVAQLEGKGIKALKRKSETVVEQLTAIHQAFFVAGALQERKLNFFDLPEAEKLLATILANSNPFEKNLIVVKPQSI